MATTRQNVRTVIAACMGVQAAFGEVPEDSSRLQLFDKFEKGVRKWEDSDKITVFDSLMKFLRANKAES